MMKMKSIASTLLLALAAAAAQSAAAAASQASAAQAAQAAAADAAYESDLHDILSTMPVYEAIVYADLSKYDSYSRALRDYYVRHYSKESLIARMVPGLKEFLSPALAARIAETMRHPAYRKQVKIFVARLSGNSEKAEPLTEEESKTVARLSAQPTTRKFTELSPKISDFTRKVSANIREEVEMQLVKDALSTIVKTQNEINQVATTGRPVPIRTIGFEPWDQVIRAVGNSSQKMALAFHHFNTELEKLNYVDTIKATNLITRQNYEEAIALIDKSEDLLATALRDTDIAIKERNQQVAQGEFAKFQAFRKKMDEQTANLYTFTGDFGEAYRNMFITQRQMVLFLQEHKGHVTVAKDSEMVLFEDDANVEMMNDIFSRMEAAGEALNAVVQRQVSREDELIAKMNKEVKKAGK